MAFGTGGGSGASARVKSDINVTPLVDVVLVLLIIFLVTMPIVMKDITIDIPKKSDDPNPPPILQDQAGVGFRSPTPDGKTPACGPDGKAGQIFLNNEVVPSLSDLSTKLTA